MRTGAPVVDDITTISEPDDDLRAATLLACWPAGLLACWPAGLLVQRFATVNSSNVLVDAGLEPAATSS